MPSTYTPGGIELIGDGEQSGNWGGTTNTNLQILDRMISQAGAITLSGTTHTLTISDGTLSDGQYGVLVFGGSPSGTNTVTISPNDAQRSYIVKNDSGESVVLTQGSGGNVTVADGKTALVYCDGAGSGAAVVDLTADLAVTALTLADLGVTASASELNTLDGITATTAELNILDGVTADATELNILDGATVTTAELNQLDGNTFTSDLTIPDKIIHAGDTDTSIRFPAADAVAFETAGSERVRVTTTGLSVTGTALATTDTDTSNTGSVTLDFAANQNFVLTLTGNVTLANPTTEQVGQSGFIVFIQDATGSRTVSLGTDYETAGGAGLTLSTAASATDVVPYIVAASGRILLGAPQLAFS